MGFDMSDYTHRVLQRVPRLVGGGGDVQCKAVVKCFPADIHVAKSSSPDDPMLHNHTKSESGLNQPPGAPAATLRSRIVPRNNTA